MPGHKVQRIMSSLPDRMRPKNVTCAEKSPDETIQEIQKQHTKVAVDTPSYSDLEGFFHAPTQAEIDAYQHDILAAVRASKIETLREFYQQGRPMKCSNEFGESILHLACRKGLTEVAKFLVEEANVPVQVCDDYGRNPLHDACWVHKPNFELMDLILKRCPDLLFIKDRRGHTPLSFARRDQWKAWNDYLKTKSPEFLAPTALLKRQMSLATPTNTTPAATAVPAKVAPKIPGVAAKGIKIPTFAPNANVAAKGIRIPVATTAINLAAQGAMEPSKPITLPSTTAAAKPDITLKPLVAMPKTTVQTAAPVSASPASAALSVVAATPASAALQAATLVSAASPTSAALAGLRPLVPLTAGGLALVHPGPASAGVNGLSALLQAASSKVVDPNQPAATSG